MPIFPPKCVGAPGREKSNFGLRYAFFLVRID